MSPTYNDHSRQATKKVTKNRRFKCRRISLEVVGGYYYSITFAMSHSVDWATLVNSSLRYIKLGGVAIQWGVADFGDQSFSTDFWGTFNRSARQDMYFNYPVAFDEKPVLIMNIVDSNKPQLGICYAHNDGSGSRSPSFTVYCPKGFTSTASVKIQWIAIGAKA